jgi:hypothetical protein
LNIRGLAVGENMRVSRVVTLLRQHGADALAPNTLDCVEDAQLVIDHHIPPCRIKALHVSKFLLLVNVDEHAAIESCPKPGTVDFPRLEHRIAIGQDDRGTPFLDVSDRIKRASIKPIAERIVDEPT